MGAMLFQGGRGVGKEGARRGGMRGPDGRCVASTNGVPEGVRLRPEGGPMRVRGGNMSHVVRQLPKAVCGYRNPALLRLLKFLSNKRGYLFETTVTQPVGALHVEAVPNCLISGDGL